MEFIKSHPEQNTLIIELEDLDFVKHKADYEKIIDRIMDFAVNLPY